MKLEPVKETPVDFAPRHYLCKRAKEKPAIDGNLSKAFWKDAPWSVSRGQVHDTRVSTCRMSTHLSP